MGSQQRTPAHGPWELTFALAVTFIWAVTVAYDALSRWLGGPVNYVTLACFTAALIVSWWLAASAFFDRLRGRRTLRELQALSPEAFEDWAAARFRALGWQVEVTAATGDHGVDLMVERAGERAIVQCKRFRGRTVGEPVLRDLYGAMYDAGADRAFLVTTGQLTRPAAEWIQGKPIEVWDGEALAQAPLRRPARRRPAPPAPAAALRPLCPQCGKELVHRRDPHTGEHYLGCPNYPACRYARPMTEGHP